VPGNRKHYHSGNDIMGFQCRKCQESGGKGLTGVNFEHRFQQFSFWRGLACPRECGGPFHVMLGLDPSICRRAKGENIVIYQLRM
jgi:hypothetical protein